jgi:hypothetical protein
MPNPEQTGLTATNEETTLNNQNITCTYVAFIATATERGRVATSSC